MKKTLAVVAAIFVAQSGVGQASMMIVVILVITVMQSKFEPLNEDEARGGSPGSNLLQWRLLVLEALLLVVELLFELGVFGEDLATVALSATTLAGIVLILPELFSSTDKAIRRATGAARQHFSAIAMQFGVIQSAAVTPVGAPAAEDEARYGSEGTLGYSRYIFQ